MGETVSLEQRRAWKTPEVSIELLTSERLDYYWKAIEIALERVRHVWDLHYTLDSIRDEVMNGNFQVWAAGTPIDVKMVVFSRIAVYPKGRVFQIFLAFGNEMEDYLSSLDAVMERWAINQGCYMVEVIGRRGWYQVLKASGFRRRNEVLVRMLEPKRMN